MQARERSFSNRTRNLHAEFPASRSLYELRFVENRNGGLVGTGPPLARRQ
jgi:hypothetical protein